MELTESNLFYRHPRLYDQVQADPQHTAATTCEELVDTFGPANARTLVDFGCGTGRDLDRLAKRFDCMGVDALPSMVDHAAVNVRTWTSATETSPPRGSGEQSM
ncbi:class I SAM-dependent methyltransferase [Amycolatopsis sp. NBC_01286]|uniref:class I SAM-dependent methyltransferase n=1 Tax=Amycolatopsis sp. NBC_01286 TaxID=2903560 RepID=UPI002E1598DD|nr:class I SAM-dependent methyltransferase [Amycolatopsis sp. NBC_01286]